MTEQQTFNRVAVVLWRGQYRNDGLDRIETLLRICPHLANLTLIGSPGQWEIVADAYQSGGNDDGSTL